MTDTKAKPRGVSLYDAQWQHAQRKADQESTRTGKVVSASEIIQQLLEKDMRASNNLVEKNNRKGIQ